MPFGMKIMRKGRNKVCVIALGAVVLVILFIAGAAKILYSSKRMGPLPLCDIVLDFDQWLTDQHAGQENPPYPNVNGSSQTSLQEIARAMQPVHAVRLLRDYLYVPGLHPNDPQDLVLLYIRERTRYTWHGDATAVRREPQWLVFSPGFYSPLDTPEWCPEDGRRLSDDQFRTRLQKTLDFLREQKRPNWENVAKEHTAFLERN